MAFILGINVIFRLNPVWLRTMEHLLSRQENMKAADVDNVNNQHPNITFSMDFKRGNIK